MNDNKTSDSCQPLYFEISRKELLNPLKTVASVVEQKQTIPILSNILIRVEKDRLHLTGTDSEVEVSCAISLEESLDAGNLGETTVPGRKFLDIINNLDEKHTIQLRLSEDGNRVELKSGKSRFTLSTLSADDYPSSQYLDDEITFALPQRTLKDLIAQTSYAMAQNDARYYLNGMCLHLMEEKLVMVATDGHRLALAEENFNLQGRESRQVIIPRKAIIELMRMLENSDDEVQIAIDESHIQFKVSESLTITSKLIDGKFPDYYGVIPFQANKIATAEVVRLKTALKQASILSNEKYRGIKLALKKNLLTVTSSNPDQEEAEVECEVEYEDEDLEIGFNVNYLQDVLSVVTTKDIELRFSDSNSSCLLMQKEIDSVKFVVMPMRL
jgi:DNA polymerase III subunit beta